MVVVAVESEDFDDAVTWMPLRQRLSGDGPWTLTVPKGSVKFTFQDAAGEALEGASIFFDERAMADLVETLEVRGVPAGEHTFVVGHPEHGSSKVVVTVAEGPVEVTVKLPKLPEEEEEDEGDDDDGGV